MRDFLLFMVEQKVFGAEEVGFARITDSAEEAVELVLRSLPVGAQGSLTSHRGETRMKIKIVGAAASRANAHRSQT